MHMLISTIDRFEEMQARLQPRLDAFAAGDQPYLVVQSVPLDVYTSCNTIEDIYTANVRFFERQLSVKSDWLPYLEPWMGTGIFANAFGCEYLWRDGDAPAVHYRYHSLEEVADLTAPTPDDSEVMPRVLEAIALFRERTSDRVPIALTDTQSANDTATLVLDATELIAGCYSDPEVAHRLLGQVNDLIIEFSRRQIEAIGSAPVARPGHIMVSSPDWRGISISDDNLAFMSVEIGREFCLRYDQQLADEFGGLAIHSCGRWQHLMPDVAAMRNIVQVDCAIHIDADPNPNDPEAVRDAFAGSGIAVKVRGPNDFEPWREILPRLVKRGLRLIVQLDYVPDEAESARNYGETCRILDGLYATG